MCWSWSTQGENVFWKSGVKSEFLPLKSTLLSGQQIITKWVAPPSNKVKPKFIKTKCFKCHSAWITVPISPPTHADCSCFKRFSASLQAQHAHPERKQPPILDTNQRKHLCFNLCFRLPTLQLSARSMAFSGILPTAATAVVWAAQTSLMLRFGRVVLKLLTLRRSPKACGLCHLPSSH